MRIAIVTDAWYPQVNGVVRTLSAVGKQLESMGHAVIFVSPDMFRGVPCPTYPEIRLALFPRRGVARRLDQFQPQAIHIATEGPVGMAARRYCVKRELPFTTSFHTRFPEYLRARFRTPLSWTYGALRRFHRPSSGIMVATKTIADTLIHWGFKNSKAWGRGVYTGLFRPRGESFAPLASLPRPVHLFTGRVAVEKNIEAFLALDLPGSKLVVGDGPMRPDLEKRFPDARFVGARHGEELACHFAAADVFVFPSRTDTFGLVLLEALASGVPVAAFPVPGPLDVVGGTDVGALDEDLAAAARKAASIPRERCRAFAGNFSWEACARLFLSNLHPFGDAAGETAAARAA